MAESDASPPLFRVGAALVSVDADDDSLHRWFRAALADLACPSTETAPADHAVEIRRVNGRTEFLVDGQAVYRGSNVANVLDHFVSWCNRLAIDSRPDFVNLHAAGISPPGSSRCAVVPGIPGAGKSSIAGAAASAGWGYLSDEMVSLGAGGVAYGYPKPLTIKRGGRALLEVDFDQLTIAESQTRWYVPPATVGGYVAEPGPVGAFVFSTYEADAATEASPMTTADAVLELATNCQDELDDAGHALLRLAEACASAVCVRLVQSDLGAALEIIGGLLVGQAPERGRAELMPPLAGGGVVGPRVAGSAVAVALDDGVVVHHPPTRQLVVLDALAGTIWQLLDGTSSADDLAADLAAAFAHPADAVRADLTALLQELADHGLIEA